MKCFCSMGATNLLFLLANLVFLVGGFGLIYTGVLLLYDTERVLLSRLILQPLPLPLFYYSALVVILVGILVSSLAVLGSWAAKFYSRTYCLLAVYLFAIVLALLGECVLVVVAAVCPQYLGIGLDVETLRDNWQRNYGVPGREQYTAAVDLAQIKFECCGVSGSGDYTTSWWRLRELAPPNLLVPLSCCLQQTPVVFLDPRPLNATLCQEPNRELNRYARHYEGYSDRLEIWLEHHLRLAMSGGMAMVLMELFLLLLAILTCVKPFHSAKTQYK